MKPNVMYRFPKRKFGKTERSFRAEWCEDYSWLHYDVKLDAAFCYLCMKASSEGKFLTSTKREKTFISTGFTYWRDGTICFKKHQSTLCHREAVDAVITLPRDISCGVGEALSLAYKQEKATNRRMFFAILQNIRFLVRQGLPFRGSQTEIDSNYIQLLLLRALDIPELSTWMNKKTDRYTSPVIQNECMKIMAHEIMRKLAGIIRECKCYTIMADECTDISNTEQFTICIRCVTKNLEDHEYFIGIYEVENISSNTLVQAIKDTLLRFSFDISDCRGQCYDGASNMSGIRNGVATQLLSEEKRAIFSHCYGHALNLAVGYTMKQSTVCSEALESAFEITKLIKYSPKRNVQFNKISSEHEDERSTGIRKFCPTQWTVRGESINSILQNYNVLKELWESCLQLSLQPDVKGRIIGIQAQMSKFKLLFGLKLCERIFLITDNLSKTLQNQSLPAAERQEIGMLTLQTLEKMRNEDDFKLFYQHLQLLQVSTNTEEPFFPRRKRAPIRLEVGDGAGYHAASVEELYRTQYYEALDLATVSIKDRFEQPGYAVYQNLEELLLKSANNKDYSVELQEVLKLYDDDFNEVELTTQLKIFTEKFSTSGNVTLREAIDYLKSLSDGQKQFFQQVCRIAQLFLVMPSTNAASERSFSVMKRIKTYLRSTMGQARLNHLMVLNVYKEELESRSYYCS